MNKNDIKKFLEVESNPHILDFCFKFKNLLIWPFERFNLLVYALEREYKAKVPHHQINPFKLLKIFQIFKYLILVFFRNPFFHFRKRRKIEYMYFTSGVHNVNIGGNYINKHIGHLARVYSENSMIIEQSENYYIFPFRTFNNLSYVDSFYILSNVISLFFPASKQDKISIKKFIDYINKNNVCELSDDYKEKVYKDLIKKSKSVRIAYRLFYLLFRLFKPKLILWDGACYGYKGYIIKIAKELNIKTAEYQHGLINENHLAYNFNKNISNSEIYKEYLPDYILLFGEYWKKGISSPVKKIVVGNPYLDQIGRNYLRGINNEIQIILIASGGMIPVTFDALLDEMYPLMDGKYKIIFRPHPSERDEVLIKYKSLNIFNIEIDVERDFYRSIMKSDFLISDYSTVLYEALYFDKIVFAVNHPLVDLYINNPLINRFKDTDDLISKIRFSARKKIKNKLDDIWAENWENNYKNFIKSIN